MSSRHRWRFVTGIDNREPHTCEGLRLAGEKIEPGYDFLGMFPEWWHTTKASEEVPGGILAFDVRECPRCALILSTELFDRVDKIVEKIWQESPLGQELNWTTRRERERMNGFNS